MTMKICGEASQLAGCPKRWPVGNQLELGAGDQPAIHLLTCRVSYSCCLVLAKRAESNPPQRSPSHARIEGGDVDGCELNIIISSPPPVVVKERGGRFDDCGREGKGTGRRGDALALVEEAASTTDWLPKQWSGIVLYLRCSSNYGNRAELMVCLACDSI